MSFIGKSILASFAMLGPIIKHTCKKISSSSKPHLSLVWSLIVFFWDHVNWTWNLLGATMLMGLTCLYLEHMLEPTSFWPTHQWQYAPTNIGWLLPILFADGPKIQYTCIDWIFVLWKNNLFALCFIIRVLCKFGERKEIEKEIDDMDTLRNLLGWALKWKHVKIG